MTKKSAGAKLYLVLHNRPQYENQNKKNKKTKQNVYETRQLCFKAILFHVAVKVPLLKLIKFAALCFFFFFLVILFLLFLSKSCFVAAHNKR